MISICYDFDVCYVEFSPHCLLTRKYNYDSDYPTNFPDRVNEMLRTDKYLQSILVFVLMHQMNLCRDLKLMFFWRLHSIFHDALIIYFHSQCLLIDCFDFVRRFDDDLLVVVVVDKWRVKKINSNLEVGWELRRI